MAPDWKASLSVLDRYDTIRSIQAADAIAIEQHAYQSASTLDEYKQICSSADRTPATPAVPPPAQQGIRIGPYSDCVPIADGVTSQVYRCETTALKVIVHRAANIAPHNPQREVQILRRLCPPCVPLLDAFRDDEQRLVLAFPYFPLTLQDVLSLHDSISPKQRRNIFNDVLRALQSIHSLGIIHRDMKPSAVLLASPNGPALLSDFGTAWHPDLSAAHEPPSNKILDIGTGPYRAPEVLFAHRAYGPPVDMWSLGVMLSEASRATPPPTPVFESRSVDEDGNQLGLILSIFKTLGTPTPQTWPEALHFTVSPFELWTVFPQRPWDQILPDVEPTWRDLIAALIRFDSRRATASAALEFPCLAQDKDKD
ncbi:hypothetical protein CDD81_8105 [Ophiocordyceps australis]|uniref:cyclin-dependent kinase n=1 Tax=Ophiocordyceps australis TaxID=1399860 RepID=A0A2C5Y431_9HYPO|nr:hypothetical protein CDD81_8105 [Ophiocordyceps australis]